MAALCRSMSVMFLFRAFSALQQTNHDEDPGFMRPSASGAGISRNTEGMQNFSKSVSDTVFQPSNVFDEKNYDMQQVQLANETLQMEHLATQNKMLIEEIRKAKYFHQQMVRKLGILRTKIEQVVDSFRSSGSELEKTTNVVTRGLVAQWPALLLKKSSATSQAMPYEDGLDELTDKMETDLKALQIKMRMDVSKRLKEVHTQVKRLTVEQKVLNNMLVEEKGRGQKLRSQGARLQNLLQTLQEQGLRMANLTKKVSQELEETFHNSSLDTPMPEAAKDSSPATVADIDEIVTGTNVSFKEFGNISSLTSLAAKKVGMKTVKWKRFTATLAGLSDDYMRSWY